ncbi:SDR family NAD(P)-dependent oxidoreductase, partial [Streptomyces sp. NPDC056730]|uniref:SDR family NAD(P)-dependent oxidoreductase n=1 Tax=Streptomyces sp. NPDC056730 TaxID=3345929 RepID=UPI0036C5ADD7
PSHRSRTSPSRNGTTFSASDLTGTFHCVQAVVPDMRAAGWGRIVTISSVSAQSGATDMAHYAAAKGGVIPDTSRAPGRHTGVPAPLRGLRHAANHEPPSKASRPSSATTPRSWPKRGATRTG